MSTTIKISSSTEEELKKQIQKLKPYLESCKIPKVQSGKFKKAYATMKD